MPEQEGRKADLCKRIQALESQLTDLKNELKELECLANPACTPFFTSLAIETKWPLDADEYSRYGRQMIIPEIGLEGQLSLKNASILVVGLGGLGCPAAVYLAGAGVGTIGLIDGDTVELSNLHRQILHTTHGLGQLKVQSAATHLRRLNPTVRYVTHEESLSPATSVEIFDKYDLILDCTDRPSTRYLISDASVLTGKPLIFASALRTEGQLMVLINPPSGGVGGLGGPCYRCVFPKPPPAENVATCAEGGILGPVVGVMGVLMALEAVKLLTSRRGSQDRRQGKAGILEGKDASMLLFTAYSSPQFRQVRLRGKRTQCIACSANATITKETLSSGSLDYEVFCGLTHPVKLLSEEERIDSREMRKAQLSRKNHIILDVRDETQYGLCHLENSINIPYPLIEALPIRKEDDPEPEPLLSSGPLSKLHDGPDDTPIYVLCRFGNDSQLAVRKLKELGYDQGGKRWVGDIKGGLKAWKKDVDPGWPDY
ncbi:MAG: Urmylation protein [Icmadophila ericetorum]|nr:Urmylation protein [Icmadophila ericetorum]